MSCTALQICQLPHIRKVSEDIRSKIQVSMSASGPSVARTPKTQVALLVHVKIFQTIGRFLPAADLAFLSPYATSKLKRFGDSPTDLKPEAMPTCTTLPL